MAEIIEQFKNSGALLDGHFLLTSGRHSEKYFEKFTLLKHPKIVETLCRQMANAFRNQKIDLVVGAATGGILLAHEVAKNLDTIGIFAERVSGKMIFRRGFAIKKGQRILLVDDVITTGGSVFEMLDLAKFAGAEIVGIAALFDRSGCEIDFGCPTVALHTEKINSWNKSECPLCKKRIPLTQRGRTGKNDEF